MASQIRKKVISSFTHHLLLSLSNDENDTFYQSVVYVCDHTHEGALGVILNKNTNLEMGELFSKLGLASMDVSLPSVGKKLVGIGGLNEPERGFVLHTNLDVEYASSITKDLSLTTSLDILEQISEQKGPEKFLMMLGCSNWESGELEQQIKDNHWLILNADLDLIFDVSAEQKYSKCLENLGIKPWQLSLFSGNG
jgi:putative transcriptional regulator